MGGGAMLQNYTSSGIGLADPEVIPILQINDGFDLKPSSTTYSSDAEFSGNIVLDSLGIRRGRIAPVSLDNLFGHVPTQDEVLKAMSDLQKLMNGLVESEANTNQTFPMQNRNQLGTVQSPGNQLGTVQSPGYLRVLDAFHMLEADPSVKKMVLSISCDKVVWEAILQNESVQNLQGSVSAAKEEIGEKMLEEPDITTLLMRWITGISKVKILELIEGFTRLLCEVFQPNGKEKSTSELNDLLEDKLRNSFVMSLVLLMIVIATRNHGD